MNCFLSLFTILCVWDWGDKHIIFSLLTCNIKIINFEFSFWRFFFELKERYEYLQIFQKLKINFNVPVIFLKWNFAARGKIRKFCFWNWTHKNVPDRHHSARFWTWQKVLYHSTLDRALGWVIMYKTKIYFFQNLLVVAS